RAVIEMKPERDHRYDVEQSDPPHLEARNDVRVDVGLVEPSGRPPSGIREMHDVQHDEDQEKHSAQSHRARCPCAYLRLALRVSNRSRRAILHRELIRSYDVQNYRYDENAAQQPQRLA